MKNKKTGFTLIEMIIYIAIIGIIVTAFISFSISISNARNKTYVVQEVNANARFALDLIAQKIKASTSISNPTKGNIDSEITLSFKAPADDITFSLLNGIIQMTEGANPAVSITTNEVSVDSFTFSNLTGKGRTNIRVEMEISFRNNGSQIFTYSDTFQNSVTTRP